VPKANEALTHSCSLAFVASGAMVPAGEWIAVLAVNARKQHIGGTAVRMSRHHEGVPPPRGRAATQRCCPADTRADSRHDHDHNHGVLREVLNRDARRRT
jgi:hypothetical protein